MAMQSFFVLFRQIIAESRSIFLPQAGKASVKLKDSASILGGRCRRSRRKRTRKPSPVGEGGPLAVEENNREALKIDKSQSISRKPLYFPFPSGEGK